MSVQITEGWPLVLFLAALPFVVWLATSLPRPLQRFIARRAT